MCDYEIHKLKTTDLKDFIELKKLVRLKVLSVIHSILHKSRFKPGDTITTHSCNKNLFNNDDLFDKIYFFFDDSLEKNIIIIECSELLHNLRVIPKTYSPESDVDFGTISFVPVKSCSDEEIKTYKKNLGGIIEIVYD